jgi:hypothetical protein
MASMVDELRKRDMLKNNGVEMYSTGLLNAAAKAPQAPKPAAAPAQPAGPGLIQRTFPNTAGAMDDRRAQIDSAQQTGGYGAALGQSARTIMNPAIGLVEDAARLAGKALNPAAQALKTFATGDATPIGTEPAAVANPLVRAATAPKTMTPQAMEQAVPADPVRRPMAQAAQPAQPEQPLATEVRPGIFRQGNSFSDSAAGAASGARPSPVSAQNMAAADALAQRYTNPLVQAAQAPSGWTGRDNSIMAANIRDGVNPYVGTSQQPVQAFGSSQPIDYDAYGPMFAKNRLQQRSLMMDAQQAKPGARTALRSFLKQQEDAPGQQIDRDRLAQGAQESAADRMARREEFGAKLGESAADRSLRSQELADNSLTNQVKRDAMGVESGAAKQMAALRSQYLDAKTPEEAAAAAAKINALSGKGTQQDEYMAVGGGETVVDPQSGLTVKNPDVLVNKRTGQPVSGQQAKPAQAGAAPTITAYQTGKAAFDALPKGARYIGPDGRTYSKN